MSPAVSLETAAERERYRRVLQAAETMLSQGGEQRLQMKELAQRAGVALATLYRYFPSKDHVLGALALERHERALQQMASRPVEGESAGARAYETLIREFRGVQRQPETSNALLRVGHAPDRATSEYSEGVQVATERMLLAAIGQGGADPSPEQRYLVPLVVAAASGAFTQWLAGNLSADQVRTRVLSASRLLDLPAEVVREYLVVDG